MSADRLSTAAFEQPEPRERRVPTGRVCDPCATGRCGRCVRAGCYHPHDAGEARTFGVGCPTADPYGEALR